MNKNKLLAFKNRPDNYLSVVYLFSKKLILLLICVLCFQTSSFSNHIAPLDTVTLKLKWKHQFQFAGYYAAIEKGYYAEAGLFVKLEEFDGKDVINEVVDGNANYGIATSEIILTYHNNKKPIVLLANIFQHSPLVLLTLKHDKGDNIHDISGKKVMMEHNSVEILAYLKNERVELKDANIIEHSFSPTDLIQGKVFATTAYITDEPYLIQQQGLEYNIYSPRASGIDFYGDLIFTSQHELKNHQDRTNAFLEASFKGWKYALENQEEIINLIYNKYTQRHSLEHLRYEAEQTQRLIMHDVVEIGYINKKRWERIGEVYADLGMLSHSVNLDGFIYSRNNKSIDKTIYFILGIIIAIASLSIYIAFRFFHLNKKLKAESDERIAKEQLLSEMEKRYRNLVENAPYPLVISDAQEGNILYLNQLAKDKFGIESPDSTKFQFEELCTNKQEYEQILHNLKQNGNVYDFVIQLKSANQPFFALVTGSKFTFDTKSAYIFGILDISYRIELETGLKVANSTKDKFISIIAHDLRSPISGLNSLLDILITKPGIKSNLELDHYLNIMKDTAQSTYDLLENLLLWARTQKGEIIFSPELGSINQIVESNLHIFSISAKNKNIVLIPLLGDNFICSFDPKMMNTVIRNLLNNAIKFTLPGGTISIKVSKNDTWVTIRIKDSGIGMNDDTISNLFSETNRLPSNQGTLGETGTGLGMILCKDFIQRHKGKITVESELTKGSEFTIEIPIIQQ